jgi:hypothetical protein
MGLEELDRYVSKMQLLPGTLVNQIDYEDIAWPIKTRIQTKSVVKLNAETATRPYFVFERHIFEDNTSRFQLFRGEKERPFTTLSFVEESHMRPV